MPVLNSSAIFSAEYDLDSRELYIVFEEGGVEYIYLDVPESLYMDLLNATSAGMFFNRFIKDKYSANN